MATATVEQNPQPSIVPKGPELVAQAPQQASVATPAELVRLAVTQGADIDKLEKLMELQLRWEQNEARKEFVAAMNAFKANPPEILKGKSVDQGTNDSGKDRPKYKYAELDKVCTAVTAALNKHDISHRWEVDQSQPTWIKVTCILTHKSGHSEETALQGAADATGGKNAIQAIGSTVTYLQRYTLLAATGLAAANTDSDGNAPAGKNRIAGDRVREQCEWIKNAKDKTELWNLYKAAYREAEGVGDRVAMSAYITAKDTRKKEIM